MNEYQIYMTFAVVASVMFIGKIFLALLGGDHDLAIHDGTEAFEMISIQSVLASFMGFGWAGLALQYEFLWAREYAFFGALLFAVLTGLLSSVLLYMTRKLNHATPRPALEIGSIGSVYAAIPEGNSGGKGLVTLVVGGSKQIYDAVTSSLEPLPAFCQIKVTEVISSNMVLVERI